MYYNRPTSRFVLIGTVGGNGYSCNDDTLSEYEGSTNGVWNKVSAHMEWIQKTMEELGEKTCKITDKMSPEITTTEAYEEPTKMSPEISTTEAYKEPTGYK